MGKLTQKLFKKTAGITEAKARKFGAEEYKKRQTEEGNQIYAEVVTTVLLVLHNDYGFGKTRLAKVLADIDEFMTGIKKYDGDVVAEAREILLKECKFNIVEEYKKIMKGV
jgi:hypothetical protein